MAIHIKTFAVAAGTKGHTEKSGKNNILNILSVSRITVL
jgi:hypothetical protein